MLGVVLYTLMEFLNFYLAYKIVFGLRFIQRKESYAIVVLTACIAQITVLYLVDDTWRDIIAVVTGFFGAIVLAESKKWITALLYPIVFFLSSFINVLGSYGIAFLLGITQEMVGDSISLTLLSECTAIVFFLIFDILVPKRNRVDLTLTAGQYLILLTGGVCFFAVIGFSQGVLREETEVLDKMRNLTAVASVVIALFFIILSIWQQVTWKKAFRYRLENEKYEMFLAGQEEHIRTLIIEDEKRRKLRHDMNAHMLALNTMVEKEDWDMLREYLGQMQKSLEEVTVNKYTMISAVDAIIDEWHKRALTHHTEWLWEGTLRTIDKVTIFELCIIFSNLLSNAVEAIEKVNENGRIAIRVSNFQDKVVISVGNTCGIMEKMQEKPQTTKGDEIFHGLGLKNVEEIVKKYDGSIDYEIMDGWFRVDIVL